jgi:hypothetical protein
VPSCESALTGRHLGVFCHTRKGPLLGVNPPTAKTTALRGTNFTGRGWKLEKKGEEKGKKKERKGKKKEKEKERKKERKEGGKEGEENKKRREVTRLMIGNGDRLVAIELNRYWH